MKITFCGATERVTGSNYFLETENNKFLVDCGLFQGSIDATKDNWQEFLFDPKAIDFVLVTHSHIDHIGRLPLLYKRGFRGKVYSTHPTKEFCRIFLEDSCNVLSETAENLGIEPLYTQNDVAGIMGLFESCDYYEEFSPAENLKVKFYDAGHILGSAIIQITFGEQIVVFSGDLGNPPVPILRDTDFIPKADYVVMESTYGDRNHEPFEKRKLELERTIEEAIKNKGALLIPAFAMERTQEIMYEINDLVENGKVSKIPIYIDSPLAIKATEIYKKFSQYFDEEAQALIKSGDDLFKFPGLVFTKDREDSKKIDISQNPKIIIAGSGMSTGGRILYHEKRYLSDPTTILLTIGFQVKGTLGRALEEGAKVVNIMGEKVEVRAVIKSIESYSAHADQDRLKYWVSKFGKKPKKIFLTHGEKPSAENLTHRIEDEEGIETEIPKHGQTIKIGG